MTFSHGESGIIWSPVVVLVLRLLCGNTMVYCKGHDWPDER
jgi:hypothetical protein